MPERQTYRLSLGPDVERFRPEIDYVFDFLDAHHPLRRDPTAGRVVHYGASPPEGAVAVPAALFPSCVQVGDDGLHLDAAAFEAAAPSLVPGGEGHDPVGLIFLLLSRLEERDAERRDRYGRYPFDADFAVCNGLAGTPAADAAARDLACRIGGEAAARVTSRYRVRLTHDVDRLRGYHRLHEPLRLALGDGIKRGRPARALGRLRDGYLGGEPHRSFRRLMDLSERHGHTSRFYFLGPSRLDMDSPYVERMSALLRRVADEATARGHVLGFHPGFATAEDEAEWRRQKDGLERVLGQPVQEGRQHVLRYRAGVTPEIWNDAGMAYDCTLAYPEVTGFRNGSCRPVRAYSLRRRRPLDLVQGSTAVMEFGLLDAKYRALSPEAAVEASRPAIAACREFGGELVVLFHTGHRDPGPWRFYETLLEEAA